MYPSAALLPRRTRQEAQGGRQPLGKERHWEALFRSIAVTTVSLGLGPVLRTWPAEPRSKGLSTSTRFSARPPPRREGDVPPFPPPALPHRNTSVWSRLPSGRCPPGSLQNKSFTTSNKSINACRREDTWKAAFSKQSPAVPMMANNTLLCLLGLLYLAHPRRHPCCAKNSLCLL